MLIMSSTNTLNHLLAQAEQLRTSGRLIEAEQAFLKILQIDQKNYNAYQALYRIMHKNGRTKDALGYLVRANAIKPSSSLDNKIDKIIKKWTPIKKGNLYQQLALFQMDTGNTVTAINTIQKALNYTPNNKETLYYFSRLLMDIRFTSNIDKKLRSNLIRSLTSTASDKQFMAHAATSALKCNPEFTRYLTPILNGNIDINYTDSCLINILNDELFISLLTTTLVTDKEFEKLITILRKDILKNIIEDDSNIPKKSIKKLANFITALATQCFNNEYIFYVTTQENKWLDTLISSLNNISIEISPHLYAIAATYKPLIQLINAEQVSQINLGHPWNKIISLQVTDLLKEKQLKTEIGTLSEVKNSVSHEVQEQYEENPFPRWLYLPLTHNENSIEAYLNKQFPQHYFNETILRPLEILVAGCGTGLIPCTYARIFPDARILAIDLSRASLAYGKRKAMELGLSNIEFIQGDILALGCLDRKFDFINCYGVLHHTGNIHDSWAILKSLLLPGGFMEIGLYSRIAREGVFSVRNYIEEKNYPTTPEGMRQCRKDLLKTDKPLLQQVVST